MLDHRQSAGMAGKTVWAVLSGSNLGFYTVFTLFFSVTLIYEIGREGRPLFFVARRFRLWILCNLVVLGFVVI